MLSRRDFISGQFRSRLMEEEACREKLQAIAPEFTDEALCREMMSLGKDPSNMNREQMLHAVLEQMRIQ